MARHGKKIHYTHWTGLLGTAFGQAAGAIATNLGIAEHEPETLLRMRGNLACWLDGTTAPGVTLDVAVGVCAVPEGTSTTVLWSPITDSDAPWIWYERFIVSYEESVTDAIAAGTQMFRAPIDNKAQRILRNQELRLVIEQATLQSAGSINTVVSLRALFGTR